MLYRWFLFAGHGHNAVCVPFTGAELAIANHAHMSVYLTVNDVCRGKNKPVGIVIGGKYMAKKN